MAASYDSEDTGEDGGRIYDILFDKPRLPPLMTIAVAPSQEADLPPMGVFSAERVDAGDLTNDFTPRLVKDRADIDISGPEFNFVRSIRVFDVRYAQQYQAGSEGDCERSAVVALGTYGTQGDFSWRRSSVANLPNVHVGLESWGDNCSRIHHRSVFVDWQDYEGNYDYEQVNY
tara:strand:+ start:283 stop:804 length:522 start_codon:yes stop_codon:yes gene_type:complete